MTSVTIPKILPILFIKNEVLLPGSTLTIPISTPTSLNMVKSRLLSTYTLTNSIIGVVSIDDMKSNKVEVNDSKSKVIGTAALVLNVGGSTSPSPDMYIVYISGICRISLNKMVMEEPYHMGLVTQLDYFLNNENSVLESDIENKGMVQNVRDLASQFVKYYMPSPSVAHDIEKKIGNTVEASLPDVVMSFLITSYKEKLDMLYTLDVNLRIKKVLTILQTRLERMQKIVKTDMPNTEVIVMAIPRINRPSNVRLRAGDDPMNPSDGINELDELQNKIVKSNLPADVNKVIMRDLHRLKKMGPFSPENSIIRNYIEFVVELPWSISSMETVDINKARKDLDENHYGMNKVKKRVLEYLAVRQLKSSARGPILCFVGPPGVGKTSIGRSIAHTLGRKFERISLGGVSNQSDIRGHRRTYIGAMPGRIIQAIKNAGVNNPVILLDEIDKMTIGIHGDPAAALLEVLDPLQNHSFVDHYLNVPFDLSQVTFIATANKVKTIPAPLLDRTEMITVSGYALEGKIHIAQNHLLPKQLVENGLDDHVMVIPLSSMETLIQSYTSEAGVRGLERQLGALCRAMAVKVAENTTTHSQTFEVTLQALEDILGPPMYAEVSVSSQVGKPGVAVGLAYSEKGGSLLVVEASKLIGGEGKLILTGHLGKVMKESAQLALNWVRGVAHQYGLVSEEEDMLANLDVHIHFPEGAVGKEGPSAGITVATALLSLFSNIPLIPGLALSGELTLRGVVLPVGGIREKILAAHRADIKKIILPKLSIKDLFYVPDSIKEEMQFIFVEHMDEVIDAAFDGLVSPTCESHSSLQSRL